MSTQGPLSPTVTVDDATVGTISWTNPNNSQVSDGVYTTYTNPYSGTTQPSHYLKATNFGFSIPTGATISGILVEVKGYGTRNSTLHDYAYRIVKGGSIGSTQYYSRRFWGTTDNYETYGSSSYLWGETWTPADINDTGFGFAFSNMNESIYQEDTLFIDHIRITVTYTEAPLVVSPFPSFFRT